MPELDYTRHNELGREVATNNPKPIPPLTQKEIRRFWSYVDTRQGQGPQGDCHEWIGHRARYGNITLSIGGGKYIPFRAHRIAYFIHYGIDPGEHLVTHRCDNKACCRKEHLQLGDHKSNMREAAERHRMAAGDENGSRLYPERLKRGDAHHGSAVSDEQVLEMRNLYASTKVNCTELSKKYKLSISTVAKMLRGELRAHVGGPLFPALLSRGSKHRTAKLNEITVPEARRKHANGQSARSLALEYGVSQGVMWKAVNRVTWKHV